MYMCETKLKWKNIHFVKHTHQLSFKIRSPKFELAYKMQVVNARHKRHKENQSWNPLQNIPVENMDFHRNFMVTSSIS